MRLSSYQATDSSSYQGYQDIKLQNHRVIKVIEKSRVSSYQAIDIKLVESSSYQFWASSYLRHRCRREGGEDLVLGQLFLAGAGLDVVAAALVPRHVKDLAGHLLALLGVLHLVDTQQEQIAVERLGVLRGGGGDGTLGDGADDGDQKRLDPRPPATRG